MFIYLFPGWSMLSANNPSVVIIIIIKHSDSASTLGSMNWSASLGIHVLPLNHGLAPILRHILYQRTSLTPLFSASESWRWRKPSNRTLPAMMAEHGQSCKSKGCWSEAGTNRTPWCFHPTARSPKAWLKSGHESTGFPHAPTTWNTLSWASQCVVLWEIYVGSMLEKWRQIRPKSPPFTQAPSVCTWGQDSCADQHIAVISVQLGCPCVILSCKQVFGFFNRFEALSLVLC